MRHGLDMGLGRPRAGRARALRPIATADWSVRRGSAPNLYPSPWPSIPLPLPRSGTGRASASGIPEIARIGQTGLGGLRRAPAVAFRPAGFSSVVQGGTPAHHLPERAKHSVDQGRVRQSRTPIEDEPIAAGEPQPSVHLRSIRKSGVDQSPEIPTRPGRPGAARQTSPPSRRRQAPSSRFGSRSDRGDHRHEDRPTTPRKARTPAAVDTAPF